MKVGNWKMNAINVQELMFADDMVLIAHSEETLQQNLKIYQEELTKINMEINTRKTNTMITAAEERKHSIKIGEKALEQVKSYNYLGTIIQDNGRIEKEPTDATSLVTITLSARRTQNTCRLLESKFQVRGCAGNEETPGSSSGQVTARI
ncbi:hypothetical protein Trydic_g14272 [Trypoxylus dichotomus]